MLNGPSNPKSKWVQFLAEELDPQYREGCVNGGVGSVPDQPVLSQSPPP